MPLKIKIKKNKPIESNESVTISESTPESKNKNDISISETSENKNDISISETSKSENENENENDISNTDSDLDKTISISESAFKSDSNTSNSLHFSSSNEDDDEDEDEGEADSRIIDEELDDSVNIYHKEILHERVTIPFKFVGENIRNTLYTHINNTITDKCTKYGYIEKDSIKIISHSSGTLKGEDVIYDVSFECNTFHPVAGMKLYCIIDEITKAGIDGKQPNTKKSPYKIHILRDYFNSHEKFNKLAVGNKLYVEVITYRFELNNPFVTVFCNL